jgi:hypothetical protein
MIASTARIGWQTTLADLALILFMVTAAAMAEKPDEARKAPEPVVAGAPVPAAGEPLAIYRVAPNAPPLSEWLANQPRDDRQNLTIVARHRVGDTAEATRKALALAREAAAAGRNPRIVIEPAPSGDLIAVLDFDGRQSGTPIARSQTATNAAGAPANQR